MVEYLKRGKSADEVAEADAGAGPPAVVVQDARAPAQHGHEQIDVPVVVEVRRDEPTVHAGRDERLPRRRRDPQRRQILLLGIGRFDQLADHRRHVP